jgi:outer membrane protein
MKVRRSVIQKPCLLVARLSLAGLALSPFALAQAPADFGRQLPSAPEPQTTQSALPAANSLHPQVSLAVLAQGTSQATSSMRPAAGQSVPAPSGTMHLNRVQAEQLALKNNPRISVGKLLALAQHQVYRETRSEELPTFTGDVTAVEAKEGSRIGADALTASRLLEHAGAGITLSQLLTDFGHTVNLVSSSKLQEKAQNASALATVEDIVLATDHAFYNALQAQALLKVAQQTVTTRQSVEHQIDELTQNKLKSTLDLAFAEVNLSQAKLLLLDARNNVDSTTAVLTAVLGFDQQINYELSDDEAEPPAPPQDVDPLIHTALQQRPDLQALNYDQMAAEKFRRAQRDLLFPTISALGMGGGTPVRPDCFGGCFPNYFTSSWYGAVGVNMNVPIFNGFLFTAESSEANFRAKAAAESTRDLRDRVVRDVRTSWLSATTAFQRVGVAAEMAKEADLGLSLAQSRYQLGLASIAELSQAQLQQTDAAIGYVNSQYQYRLSLSTLNFEIGVQP